MSGPAACTCGRPLGRRNRAGLCRACCGRGLQRLQRMLLDPVERQRVQLAITDLQPPPGPLQELLKAFNAE